MKDIKKYLLVSLIITSILGSGISSASAATVDVSAGLDNSQIQALIDSANSGDTIQFLGNEYDNIALVINKTLNLVGAKTGTIIKAINNTAAIPAIIKSNSITNTAAFYFINTSSVSANDSSISGFNITNMANSTSSLAYYNTLIYSKNVGGLKIFNNSLDYASWGIYSNLCPNVEIFNNTVKNMNTTGILAFGSAKALIANNTVLNSSNHGIDVRHGSGYNATVTGNVVDGANEGIYLMHSAGHNVYNNTILNTKLSSITAYGAADVNIYNNNMSKSFVGVLLASGFENINIQNNTYSLTSTMFPPTFPYYILIADSSTNSKTVANGTFTDSLEKFANISLISSYANSSVTNGKSTTYVVKVSNSGNSSATNVTINNLLPSGDYTNYKIQAVSRGTFNAKTGTWNLDSLNANSDAIIVFTVTAKKSGSIANTPSANYTDNGGQSTVTAKSNSLNINKDIRTSYATAISSTKVKQNKLFYITIALKNIGLDTSGTYKVQIKQPTALSSVGTTQTSPFKYSNGTWTGKIGSNKTIVLKKYIKINKKGTYKIPVVINGKTVKTYTVTGN